MGCAMPSAAQPERSAATSGAEQDGADLAAGLGEASGVTVKDGVVYVVDDERGVLVLGTDAKGRTTARVFAAATADNGLKGLEGIAVKDGALVVVNEAGVVSAVDDNGGVRELARLPTPEKKNKGYEGIAVWRAPDGVARVLVVNEGKPKALHVLSSAFAPELSFVAGATLSAKRSAPVIHPLPDAVDDVLDDISDVGVDDSTGDILLLSDESRRVVRARLSLSPPSLTVLKVSTLPVGKDEKAEGIVVDKDGRALLVTDGGQRAFFVKAGTF
jgi:uncharacterized protein YjiK